MLKSRCAQLQKLDKVGKEDLSLAGGKGANLGEMIRAGLPVPGGFVVLTGAYYHFLESNNLMPRIETLLSEIEDDNLEKLEKISRQIQELFTDGDIPADIKEEIEQAYAATGCAEVAVRSSATAEDLPGTSFAGQYSTYLNVRGKEELYHYLKKCWASLWNYRALAYRVKQGIPHQDLAHGVVVQSMINADISGILFTANPVNGRRDQMLLNSSWGLGEAIVGGEVSPDQWILDKTAGTIVEERVALKEVMTVRSTKGIDLVEVPEEKQNQVSLHRDEVFRLLEWGRKVEAYFGSPQDIEWAYQDGDFFLVQTRPITSLYPLPGPVNKREGLRIHVNFSLLSQGMQEPFTPMGENIFMKTVLSPAQMFDRRIKDERDLWWLQSVGGRLFVDYTELLRNEKRWKAMVINDLFSDQEPLTARALLQWLEINKEEVTAGKCRMLPWILKKIIPCLRIAWPMLIATVYGEMFPLKAREKALQQWDNIARSVEEESSKLSTMEERLEFIEKQIGSFFLAGFTILCYIAPSFKNVKKAEKIAAPYFDDCSDFRLVEKSLPHNSTTKMGLELMQIAQKLDEDGRKPGLEDEDIQKFLEKYGHRSVQEVDIGIPRWKEEPVYVLGLLRTYINNQSYRQGLDNFYRGVEEAEAAIDRITARLRQAGARRKAQKVEQLLRNYRKVFGLREHSKFIFNRIYQVCRELLIEVGEELQEQGRLEDKMDVFYVRYFDIYSGSKLQEKVRLHKEAYRRYHSLTAPRLISSTGESIYAATEEKEGVLAGIPVSAGTYQGRARILHSPEEGYRLEKGDVLVTRGTNPAWTPLFLNLGGIIMETGGPISHGAVVAREYGIPAVIGIGGATEIIREGQTVRINGESGQVELLD